MTDHTDYKELVDQIRSAPNYPKAHSKEERYAAADAIEALQSDKAALQARVKELEAALDEGKIWSRIRFALNNCEALIARAGYAKKYEEMSDILDEISRRLARAALKGGA